MDTSCPNLELDVFLDIRDPRVRSVPKKFYIHTQARQFFYTTKNLEDIPIIPEQTGT